MERKALLQWLYRVIREAHDPFATPEQVAATAAGDDAERVDAIEVRILGRRLRIVVEELG